MKMFIKKQRNIFNGKVNVFLLIAAIIVAVSAPVQAYANDIIIDGYNDDWDDKPGTYVYNWDNSANCWKYGVWVDGVCYTTPEGEYSTDVRHYVQAYKGDEGIAVHVVFSRDYQSGLNSECYVFDFADGSTKFQFTDEGGEVLTNTVNNMDPGTYTIQLKHGDGDKSSTLVTGATATLHIPEDGVNPEIEFYIPYEAFTEQNEKIDANDMSSVSMTNPNIMYDKVYIEGAPTGSMFSIVAGLGLAGVFFIKKSGRLDCLKNRKTKV